MGHNEAGAGAEGEVEAGNDSKAEAEEDVEAGAEEGEADGLGVALTVFGGSLVGRG